MSLFLSNLLLLRIFIIVGGGGGKSGREGRAELKVTPPGLESAPSNVESTKFDVGHNGYLLQLYHIMIKTHLLIIITLSYPASISSISSLYQGEDT